MPHIDPMADSFLSQFIREMRVARNLTQADAAEMIGISRGYLAGIETGRDVPGRDTMVKLAHFFNVSLDQLHNRPAAPTRPLANEVVEDEGELALLAFWRSLTPDQRLFVAKLLHLPERKNDAA